MRHDVRLLRSFVALADEQHFGRAAKRLHITQPALSQQIQRLEGQLGVALLDRNGRQPVLTDAGRAVLAPARAATAAAVAVEEVAAVLRGGHRGEVLLGFSPGAHLAVQVLLDAFGGERPAVRVRAIQASSRALAEQVADGRLDLAIGFATGAGPGYRSELLAREKAVLAVGDRHRLSAADTVRLAELGDETFALVDAREGPGYNAAVVEICRTAGLQPRLPTRADGPMAWETAVRAGDAVGLTTRSTARSSAAGIRLVAVDPTPTFAIDLISPAREDALIRPAVLALAETARALGAAGALTPRGPRAAGDRS